MACTTGKCEVYKQSQEILTSSLECVKSNSNPLEIRIRLKNVPCFSCLGLVLFWRKKIGPKREDTERDRRPKSFWVDN